MKKAIIIIGVVIFVVALYNELTSSPKPSMQIVPVGQQPKDPTKPWCYEQQTSDGHKVIVCG